MKQWTRTLLVGIAGLSLAFAACGDDGTTDNDTSSTDTMTADTGMEDSSAEDTTTTAATDQCLGAEDLAVIQGAATDPPTHDDPVDVATACGTSNSCLPLAFAGDKFDEFEDCVQSCMLDATTGAGLTAGCSLCYSASVRCTAENCLGAPANCAGAPESAECLQCRADNGCTGGFYDCSGLTPPSE